MAPTPHPLVDAAHVREPCTAKWDAMVGSDRIRFCASCRKDVYDLSAFTADEAEVLLRGASGRVCIIVERDVRGRTLTADRLPPPSRRPLRRLATIATAASVAFGAGACGKSQVTPAPDASTVAPDGGAGDASADARRPGCYCQPGDPLCSCL